VAVTIEDVRVYAKDSALLNVLLEGKLQSPEELIELALRLSVNDFNIVQPITNYVVGTFPANADVILIYGVLHHLANAEAERQLRNQVTYSAQGVSAGIDDKFEQYFRLAQYYKGLFDQKIREYKMAQNADAAWGGVHSPYRALVPYRFRD
jgi:hypothetical protein